MYTVYKLAIKRNLLTGELKMKQAIDAIESIAGELADLNLNPTNDFGYTIGDELHELNYYLKSISESLEKIANKE